MQRKSPLIPPLSRFVPRMMVILPSTGRVPSVVVHPSPQCVHPRGVLHLPWARLISVWAGSECTDRADINAHSAFLALQMLVLVGHNQLRRVSVDCAQQGRASGVRGMRNV